MGTKIRGLVLGFVFLSMPISLWAADTTAAAYSQYQADARAAGMGMAATAWTNDATAVYWNPATLVKLKKSDLVVMTSTAFDSTYASLFVAGPMWGIGYSFTGTGGIYGTTRNTDNISDRTGAVYDFAGHVVYIAGALPITDSLSIGVTGKYLAETISTTNVSGFGLNVGVRYQMLSWCRLGVVGENLIAPVLQWNTPDQTKETLAFKLRTGLEFDVVRDVVTLSTDYVSQQNRGGAVDAGIEYRPIPLLSVSGGVHEGHVAVGTGLILDQFRANMAWEMAPQTNLDDLYRFSIGLDF